MVFKNNPQLTRTTIRLFIVTAFAFVLLIGLVSSATAVSALSMVDLDYETGNLNNAWGWYCSEHELDDVDPPNPWGDFLRGGPAYITGVVIPRLEQISSPVAEGSRALNATTSALDIVHGGARAELVYCNSNNQKILWGENDDVWYSWYTMFPSNVDFTKQKWLVWTQWHHTGLTSSPPLQLAMNERNNIQYLYLQVASHYYEKQRLGQNCNLTVNNCGILWIDQLQQGKWYKINLHVIWSTCQAYGTETYQNKTIPKCNDNPGKGLIEMWVDGNKVVGVSHFTLYPDKNSPYGVDENGVELGNQVYLKQGIYRNTECTYGFRCSPSFFPQSDYYQSLYHDRILVIK